MNAEALRQRFNVLDEHRHLFRRMLEMLVRAGILEEMGDEFVVKVGVDDPLPEGFPADPDEFADRMSARYENWPYEIALFKRCGGAVGESLTGETTPLTLLFGSGEPTAGECTSTLPCRARQTL